MLYKNLSRFLFLFIILLTVMKLYTAIVVLSDDPYKFFVFKKQPSLYNKLVIENDEQFNEFVIIFSDENKLLGQDIYYQLVSFNVIAFMICSLMLLFIFVKLLSKRSKQ